MIGSSVKDACVHVGVGAARESVEEVGNQLRLQVSDDAYANFGFDYSCCATREIHGSDAKSFIHRHYEISSAKNAAFVAERLRKRLAEGDADVFDRVMLVDVEIAVCRKLQIKCAVVRKEFQHVIKDADAGRDFVTSAAFDRETKAYLRFFCIAVDGGFSHRATF